MSFGWTKEWVCNFEFHGLTPYLTPTTRQIETTLSGSVKEKKSKFFLVEFSFFLLFYHHLITILPLNLVIKLSLSQVLCPNQLCITDVR